MLNAMTEDMLRIFFLMGDLLFAKALRNDTAFAKLVAIHQPYQSDEDIP